MSRHRDATAFVPRTPSGQHLRIGFPSGRNSKRQRSVLFLSHGPVPVTPAEVEIMRKFLDENAFIQNADNDNPSAI